MTKDKNFPTVTGPHIIEIDKHGIAHLVPKKNEKARKAYNSKVRPEERSHIFDYDPAKGIQYYKDAAKGKKSGSGSAENDFATQKIVKRNSDLEKANADMAAKLKAQAEENQQ